MSEVDQTGVLLEGRYRVRARLGQGGMGTVYAAEHVGLGQRRAIKFLRPDIARKPDAIKRFLQEARVLSAMHHENLVGVFDMGEYAGSAYYVMEFLEGEDLRSRLRSHGKLNWPQTREIALQVCEALRLTHARGVVHRDLKPENCYCVRTETEDGLKIKLLDFGVAKVPKEVGGTSQLTATGEMLGTIGYMPPEQLAGQGDHRVDVYSLGAMMFEMLAGRPVYVGNAFEVITKMLRDETTALVSVCEGIDPAIEQLIDKATHKNPAERFASMEAFAAAITAIPIHAEPQTVSERGKMVPDRSKVRASVVDVAATTMQGKEPVMQDKLDASVARQVEDLGSADHAELVSPVDVAAPAVIPANIAPRRRVVLWIAATMAVGAGVAWSAWPSNKQQEPATLTSPTNVTEVDETTSDEGIVNDERPVGDGKLETSGREAPVLDGNAPTNDRKPPPLDGKALADEAMPPVHGKAAESGAGSVKPDNSDMKGSTIVGRELTMRGVTKVAPALRPLDREGLKLRLASELRSCRSKYTDDVITIRVTPGNGGKIVKLASVDDAHLASVTIDCIEKKLKRIVASIKVGVETNKAMDVSLTLTK